MLLYDFPEAYDLYYTEDFRTESIKFYQKLFHGKKINDVLECACGSGQITIPLTKIGYNVIGCDVNMKMLNKARLNFSEAKLPMPNLVHSDFLNLTSNIKRDFDLVMNTGNSLAHVPNADLSKALLQMDALLRPGGVLYLDSRNWDLILKRQQRFYLFNPIIRDKGRINYLQVWDYNRDESMTFNFLFSEEIENKIVSKRQFYVQYFPFKLEQIIKILKKLQYQKISICKLGDVTVSDPEQIDWYVITAVKPFPELLKKKK